MILVCEATNVQIEVPDEMAEKYLNGAFRMVEEPVAAPEPVDVEADIEEAIEEAVEKPKRGRKPKNAETA